MGAAMRLGSKATAQGQMHIVDGVNLKATPWMRKATDDTRGYTYQRKNGLITSVGTCNTSQTDPLAQLNRLTELGANPADYFKQAKQSGLNPAESILKMTKSGPDLPTRG